MKTNQIYRDKTARGFLIADLGRLVRQYAFSLENLPDIISQIIDGEEWQSYVSITGKQITNNSFVEFLNRKPPSGPGCTVEMMLRICKDHKVWDDINELCTGTPGGDRKSDDFKRDNITLEKVPGSTSKASIRQEMTQKYGNKA